MTTVTFRCNDAASAVNAWMQSEDVSQATGMRATAMLNAMSSVAGGALEGLQLTFKTYCEQESTLIVADFTDLVNGQALRLHPIVRQPDSDDETPVETRRVFLRDKSWTVRPGGDRGEGYGRESEILVVVSNKIAAYVLECNPLLKSAISDKAYALVETEGLAIACLDRGAIAFSLAIHNKWGQIAAKTYQLDNTVAPAEDRPMNALLEIARVYHNDTFGTLVCVEPNTMTESEKREFLNVDENLTSGHFRRNALIQGNLAQEMSIFQIGNSPNYEFVNRVRTNGTIRWGLTEETLKSTLPWRGTNPDSLDLTVDGNPVSFARVRGDSPIWADLYSKHKAGSLQWLKKVEME